MAELKQEDKPLRQFKQKKTKKLIVTSIVGILLVSIGVFTFQKMSTADTVPRVMQTVKVERGDVTETISASGTVQASKTTSLDFSSSGSEGKTLTAVHVQIGDKVKKGQVLAILDNTEATVQVKNAEANLLTAQAKLKEALDGFSADEVGIQDATVKKAQLALTEAKKSLDVQQAKEQMEQAKTDVTSAQKEYGDQKYLYDAGAVSESELIDAKEALRKAQVDYNTAKRTYNQTVSQTQTAILNAEIDLKTAEQALKNLKSPQTQSVVTSAKAAVQQAEAELEQRKFELHSMTLVAPMDGIVTQVNGDLGAVPENPFIVIDNSDSANLEVLAQVSQGDIGKIKTGMKATFTTTSFENETFTGKVTKIYPEATTESGVTTYNVLLTVDNNKRLLMTGMTVSATIQIGTHKNVLYIPASALQERNGKDGVMVSANRKTDQKTTKQDNLNMQFTPIEVGYYTADRVEIITGLQEGDEVVISFQSSSNANSLGNSRFGGSKGGMQGIGIPGGSFRMGGGMR
ncbi:efflux RND transporter periplasmic adaptor subunit [Schinkia sp. CFF1]